MVHSRGLPSLATPCRQNNAPTSQDSNPDKKTYALLYRF